MPEILVATDADWILDEVRAALGGEATTIRWVRNGKDVLPALQARAADLVVLDLQIGNMGGMATCMDIRLESGAGRLPDVGVLMLLDRSADVFLAQRSNADGWLIKPLDAFRLRRAADAILRDETYQEGVPEAV
jgi:DNA-binding response OmpR family regulator